MRLHLFKVTKVFSESQISCTKGLETLVQWSLEKFPSHYFVHMCFESSIAIIFQIQQGFARYS